MNTMSLIYLLLIILIMCFAVIGATLYIYYKSEQDIVVKNKKKQDFFYDLYILLNKFSLCRMYFNYIKGKITRINALDMYELNRLTIKISFVLFSIVTALMIFTLQLEASFFYKVSAIIIIIILHNEILDTIIEKIDFKLLISFEKFINTVRHYYHEHNMIDEAIYSTIAETDNNSMEIHANTMYRVLSNEDVDTESEKYYEMSPNKFFKTFMSLSYVTLKFGDKKINDRSLFLSNLNYLKQELNVELLKREKLNYIFQSLNFIVLAPIFFMKPLEIWAITNLPELVSYYNSSLGFIVELILLSIIFISYILIRNMKKVVSSENELIKGFYSTLLNIKPISVAIRTIIHNNYTKKEKIRILLKQSGVRESIDVFYLKKISMFLLVFILSIFAINNMHVLRKEQILGSYNNILSTEFVSDAEIQTELLQEEILYLYKDNRNYKDTLEEDIRKHTHNLSDEEVDEYYKNISKDIDDYQNSYFKWYQLILCIMLGWIGMYIPNLIIIFRKKMLQMALEDEVMQFQSIILMLMHMERIDVLDILEWIEQFSMYFKDSITVCINNYSKGDVEALEQLKIDEPYTQFTRIVENLISSCNKIPINKAFEELELERNFLQEKRKQDNEIMINKKEAMGRFIAFIPMTAVMLLFLLLPFMMVSLSQLSGFTNQLNGMM